MKLTAPTVLSSSIAGVAMLSAVVAVMSSENDEFKARGAGRAAGAGI